MGPRHVLTKRVKGLVQQGLLKLSGSKIWGVADGPGFYQHRPKRFLLLLLSVSSSALFVSVGRAAEAFVLCLCSRSSFFFFCISVVRCSLSRFTFAYHNERVRYSFCFVHCSVLGYLVRFYFLISYYLLLCCVLPQGLCKPNGSECHFTTPQETRTRFI